MYVTFYEFRELEGKITLPNKLLRSEKIWT